MNTTDIVILVLLGIGAYGGYKKGLLMELISLVSLFVGVIVGIKLLDWGVIILSRYLTEMTAVLPIIAFAIIFIGVIVGLNWLGKALKQVLDMTLLGKLDDIAGGAIGAVKWAFFASIIVWIIETLQPDFFEGRTSDSRLFPLVSALAPGLFHLLAGLYPTIMDIFDQSHEHIKDGATNV